MTTTKSVYQRGLDGPVAGPNRRGTKRVAIVGAGACGICAAKYLLEAGFDVTVHRTVYQGDEVLRRDAFLSRYIAVGPTVVYGPGTNPPRIDFTLPPPE